jgi:ribosomal-protein-alanine N-acetyltransferase
MSAMDFIPDASPEFPTLISARVILRPLRLADAPDILRVFSDPAAMRYWSSPPMSSPVEATRLIEEIQARQAQSDFFQWGVVKPENDSIIGTCTLFQIVREHKRAEVGFILRSDLWGQGLAREAVALMINHAFRTLGLNRLEADVDPRNERCLNLLQRLGFRKEGRLRERWHVGGEVQDSVLLGLLEREW